VVVRRSEDLGNHQRLVSANVVARHLSEQTGTHHAIDVKDMFDSIDIKCNITSSDITTPSQLMHATRFNIKTKSAMSEKLFNDLIDANPFLAKTNKFDSNFIFELGRRYGAYGRIYNHAIILTNNIIFSENNIKGWAFVPQEGNSLISTLHAFLLQTQPDKAENTIDKIKTKLLRGKW
jgi:glyceraldehyde-3-phosphate dehydrogenase (NAD(P))